MSIPKKLLEQIDNNNVVPFIGAGFSYLFGYPTWNELLTNIIKKLKIDIKLEELEGKNPLYTAEALFRIYRDNNYETIFEEVKSEFIEDSSSKLNQSIVNYINEEVEKRIEKNLMS